MDKLEERIELEVKPEYQDIYKSIKGGANHINEICKTTQMNVAEISSILLMMELEGLIVSKPGNYYELL